MKKVVITGGCGYIGSHISRALKKDNDKTQIYIIDKVRRDHTLRGINGYLIDDFSSKKSLLWIQNLEPNVIIHCAGSSLVGESVINPSEYYENNISKTEKLLSSIKEYSEKPLILFSSSASVYGNPSTSPIEETELLNPISPYGFSKLVIEQMLKDFNKAYEIPSVSFRYFNAAGCEPFDFDLGPTTEDTHIIPKLIQSLFNDSHFTLNGNNFDTEDKTCIRDYVHVWDIALAHILAIKKYYNSESKESITINLGTEHGISNQELINYINSNYKELKITHGERRDGDPNKLIASYKLANKILQWKPQFSTIEKIIDSTYQWYSKCYKK